MENVAELGDRKYSIVAIAKNDLMLMSQNAGCGAQQLWQCIVMHNLSAGEKTPAV